MFARAPVPGRVKTRLIGRFSAEQVCELYEAFVQDLWATLASARGDAELFLYADGAHPKWTALAGPRFRLQRGANLGQRMLDCFTELQAGGYGPLLIVGSDSPALPPGHLEQWTEMLAQHAAVLGPAEDGGYWAMGCRAPHHQMFDGVEWSSPRTLAQTAVALSACGMPPAYLPQHYDVDTPEDLARLAAEPELPRHTRQWLRQNYKPRANSRKRRA